ncbi:MAG: pilus assembly protein [Actinomycetota bacterium]|nr:pilus assembly protein [Actinomycetota bacterium]
MTPAPPGPAQRGQAAVELALVLPLVAVVVLLVAQTGLVVRDQVLVVHAAREAAREAAVNPSPGAPRRAALAAVPLDPARLEVRVGPATDGALDPAAVTARVSYRTSVFVPMLRALFPDILLLGRASMRQEYVPVRAGGPNR